MKVNRVLLTITTTIILHSITYSSQQKTILTWGMSARVNGLHSGTQFYQEHTFSHAVINGHHFFGVFDGYGGAPDDSNRVCDMLKDNLHIHFEQTQGDVQDRMEKALSKIEKQTKQCDPKHGGFNLTQSSAVIAYITLNRTDEASDNQKIHLAHVGNSRALNCGSDGKEYYATRDHTIDEHTIKTAELNGLDVEKINYQGKRISQINGLTTSHIIGNPIAKGITTENRYGDSVISATPDYVGFSLYRKEKNGVIVSGILNNFIVIATKGLWDVMTNEQVIAFVNEKMNTPLEELQEQHPHNPKTTKKYENIAIMNTLLMLINQPIKEWYNIVSEKEFYTNYKGKSWETIAQECEIATEDIRQALRMTPEQFDATYPYNGINRTPLHDDFVEEDCGKTVMHDTKCMLVARALRDKANSDGNISVTIIDLSHPYPFEETIHGWWYFKKRSFCISLIAAIIGMLYCKCS